MAKKNALGRGLDALITFNESEASGSSSISEVELDKIIPNPDQPRRAFSEEGLNELAASIRSIGVIQPVTLRKLDEESYQIIAGERRYRASQMAGLHSIPAYIKIADEDETMEMALIENIQREDLNSIEIALAYQTLIKTLSLTQEQLSERVGKKRATVTNYLRLLKLPAEVQMGVKDKKIEMGHARALVTIDDPVTQLAIYNNIIEEGLSVRKVEMMVREKSDADSVKPKSSRKRSSGDRLSRQMQDGEFDALKQHLSTYFRTDVQFTCNKSGKGKITIPFHTPEELERLIVMFDKMNK
ncbi:MAG TPA: ParB/RepB/Spo0J family partition protein [Proteiniphilum sp.]|nr:ParB/RepB/Spo0J family partition protein [Dysgonomonadaceae bacterium zrk40]HOO94575.1 ParB/RepB/Spo0J family partition protein [Proteiniphilum sp.]HPJ49618.1 ParB/RepB/Spo0J family partition protein [Proteiniphilum sp.]HPR19893.1 ParB/RepB/Spo0J family partition protein [Proteiniphilum sp.]